MQQLPGKRHISEAAPAAHTDRPDLHTCRGTMAHSWVQMFDEYGLGLLRGLSENAVLLVDTYNTLKSSVPNAIVFLKRYLFPGNN